MPKVSLPKKSTTENDASKSAPKTKAPVRKKPKKNQPTKQSARKKSKRKRSAQKATGKKKSAGKSAWSHISGVLLSNFKGFRGNVQVAFRPLTILTGPNSAGKSTIVQPLLLLKQTLETSGDRSPLLFNGMIHLGSAKRVLNDMAPSDEFSVGALLSAGPVRDQASQDLELTLEDFALEWTFGLEPETCLRRFRISGIDHDKQPHILANISLSTGSRKDNARRFKYELAIPHASLAKRASEFMERLGTSLKGLDDVSFNKLLPESVIIEGFEIREQDGKHRFYVPVVLLSPLFNYTLQHFERVATSQLHYIGPIRDAPTGAHFDSGPRSRIGSRGEDALAYLRSNADQSISSGMPDGSDGSLLDSTNAWLEKLEGGEPLNFIELGEDFYEARTGRRRIHEVGYGIGQMLPIIVQCLAASSGSTVIVEQPEIHLHQRLQAGLADFFISMIDRGIRVVVETHSEILILRIRRRVAERNSGLQAKVAIYFVDDNVVESIPIDSEGNVGVWPDRFFDQGLTEIQALAEAQFRLREGREKGGSK